MYGRTFFYLFSKDKQMTTQQITILPLLKEAFPPERAPSGNAPVGVNPLRCSTDSDSSL